jgi:transcription elongation GreA/GreB family factor
VSKAFTSEESDGVPAANRPAPPAGERRPITPRGFAELQLKLKQARLDRDAAERDARAGLLGASSRLQTLGQWAALLEGTLATVDVVEPPEDATVTAFGLAVAVRDEDGKRSRYTLVGPDETDPKRGLISAASPLGRALLGLQVGDEVEVDRPRGKALLVVEEIARAG